MSPRLSRAEIDAHLPLKPLVFEVLLALLDGERHGWGLVREVQQRGAFARHDARQLLSHAARHARDGLIDRSRSARRYPTNTMSGGATSG